ncbi:hypothetical protein ACMU_18430 [Actibacterium mucosum KCTC 23349]|uniref:SnoaL-like domain-containing protein n=1 Tax=Actibacterium mucosum KCTC 23349 TaxID=1454373 RepID=A0A037ZI06_9RHOB|nr:nuclear transport factor 2 family protein [Actibacterium mucosum]KAJ54405.1 hypothetical protein ACMU_18430 [Actibacterium mucosum KCTC 23349]
MTLPENATPRQVAESYWAAECTRDVDAILAHYHEDAAFTVAGTHLVGHDQIATFYASSGAQYPGLVLEITHEVSNGPEASLEWTAHLTDPAGKTVVLKGVNIIRVEGGKFRTVRAYFDPSAFD